MALFPQFPYSNLHELNLDWIIEQIRQIAGEGVVLSVNGLSGVVTLYTDKDVVFPDLNYNDHWQIFREIDNKIAGLKFTGEKFFYITKNEGDEEFTVQEVYTSGNQPPYPVTSVNERTGNVVLAGDNIPYNIDGSYTIEDIITPLEKSIGHVIRYNTCAEGVSAGQYVYLILSGISGRSDGLYRAVNAKSAGTVWTASDLAPVAGGLGALMASNDSAISQLNNAIANLIPQKTILASGASFTLNMGDNVRFTIECITNAINNMFSISGYSSSSYAISLFEKNVGSGVTFDVSVPGKLTINQSASRNYTLFITANTTEKLDTITLAT